MKLVEITASLGRTIQFEQYQPHTFHTSAKVEIEEGEYAGEAFKLAFLNCENSMKTEIDKFKKIYELKKNSDSPTIPKTVCVSTTHHES